MLKGLASSKNIKNTITPIGFQKKRQPASRETINRKDPTIIVHNYTAQRLVEVAKRYTNT